MSMWSQAMAMLMLTGAATTTKVGTTTTTAVATTQAVGPNCIELEDNLKYDRPAQDGSPDLFCIDVNGDDDAVLLVVYESHHPDVGRIEVNDDGSACQCEECVSLQDAKCQGANMCSCNMHCLQGVCSHTVSPIHSGTWYIRVIAKHEYTIKARLYRVWDIDEGVSHQGDLASVDPFINSQRVTEATPWWDYYRLEAPEDGLMTVTVKNLEDSGYLRGFVEVYMRNGEFPDQENNDAVYSTYTRDVTEAHLKDVKKGDVAYIGILGKGDEEWIRYTIKAGSYKFATVYIIIGVVGILALLGAVVWYIKQRMQASQRTRLFHSNAYAEGDF